MEYRIIIACDVPCYRTYDLEAANDEEAIAKARAIIDAPDLENDPFDENMNPDYSWQDAFRVVNLENPKTRRTLLEDYHGNAVPPAPEDISASIADLLHLANRMGLDISAILDNAKDQFNAELAANTLL